MPLRPAIVHLIGFPASGKYTVAKALAIAAEAEGERCVLMDNHLTGNVILSVLDITGIKPVPEVVWERVGEVREVVYRTIEELSPPRWSFVFTNVLQAGDRADEAVVDRLARLAEARGSLYLPVRVRCELDELIARVPNPDRRARQKWIDPDAVRTFIGTTVLVDLERHDPLDLDTTTRRPEESAQLIVDHWIAHR